MRWLPSKSMLDDANTLLSLAQEQQGSDTSGRPASESGPEPGAAGASLFTAGREIQWLTRRSIREREPQRAAGREANLAGARSAVQLVMADRKLQLFAGKREAEPGAAR